jgi:glycosyltransferase involved in cell wall biosynthesis
MNNISLRKQVKVLFPVGSFYPSQSGGPSNAIYWLTSALKKINIETVVITTNRGIQDEDVSLDQFINNEAGIVRYCKEKIYFISPRMLYYSIKNIKECDIIHLTSLFFVPSLVIAIFARVCNKKIVWSVRGELEEGALNFKRRIKVFYLFIIKRIINKDFVFHCTSESEVANTRNIFATQNTVKIPNYIKLPKKYNLPIKKQILYLGRIHPIKNLESLIKGLAKVKSFKEKKYFLMIAGTGSAKYLKKLNLLIDELDLREAVVFLGMVTGEKKEKLLAESYMLVLPSFSENFGNVVVESLSQSTPVIASFGTPWEVLEERGAGYWVDSSVHSLAESIERLLSLDQEEYNLMRENSYELVSDAFDIERNVCVWLDKYNQLYYGS